PLRGALEKCIRLAGVKGRKIRHKNLICKRDVPGDNETPCRTSGASTKVYKTEPQGEPVIEQSSKTVAPGHVLLGARPVPATAAATGAGKVAAAWALGRKDCRPRLRRRSAESRRG